MNETGMLRICCCRTVCRSCEDKIGTDACPFYRLPCPEDSAEQLARLRRHVENEVPEAIKHLASCYAVGSMGLVQSYKKAAKLYKRAAELGNTEAMVNLGWLYGPVSARSCLRSLWTYDYAPAGMERALVSS